MDRLGLTIADRHFNLTSGQRLYGERVRHYARYLEQTDPLADDVVAAFSALPAGRAQRMLNTALDEGIDAVPDPPPALRSLFAQLDRVPL